MLSDQLTKNELSAYLRLNKRPISVKDLPIKPSNTIPSIKGKVRSFLKVDGITDEKYSRLNGTTVERYNSSKLPVPKHEKYTHKIVRNDNGDIQYELKDKPSPNSIPVLSTISLGLPYKYTPNNEGLGYASRLPDKRFGYYIPDEYLYPIHLTALVVSSRNNMKAYVGESLLTYEMGHIFVGIIPFNGKINYVNTTVLQVKASMDWSNEIRLLKEQLMSTGVIPLTGALDDSSIPVSDPDMVYTPVDELSLAEQRMSKEMPGTVVSHTENSDVNPAFDD
jgi:hypothetical protein